MSRRIPKVIRIKALKRSVVATCCAVMMNVKTAAKNANNASSSKDVFDLNTGVIFRKDKKKGVCFKRAQLLAHFCLLLSVEGNL